MEMPDLKKYVGRRYEDYNCLDLVKEFYKEFFNLEIKNYFDGAVPGRGEVQSLINTNRGDFVRVDVPQFGDLVVIRVHGLECHLGVVVQGTKFLHSAEKIGSNIDRLERYNKLIAGYYRHREVS